MASTDCVIGLGSNLGDRVEAMRAAVRGIRALGEVVAASGLYETDPVGPPQPDYLNAALRLSSDLEPGELLRALLDIEAGLGRVRRERLGPRVIDLDFLWAEGQIRSGPGLALPHPRLLERAFALVPLLDVAPDAVDPVHGELYAVRGADIDRSGIRLIPGTAAGAWL